MTEWIQISIVPRERYAHYVRHNGTLDDLNPLVAIYHLSRHSGYESNLLAKPTFVTFGDKPSTRMIWALAWN